MKHVFIVNPTAGQGNAARLFLPKIENACKEAGVSYAIHITPTVDDARSYTRLVCESGELCRFYACGGDGTLNEVVNGCLGYENAQVAAIPAGTGNDFCRNFLHQDCFLDMKAQLLGMPLPMDLICYGDRCAVNMVNIGFDSEVVDRAARLKKKPFLSGSLAYWAGVGVTFLKKFGKEMTVLFGDGRTVAGEFLMVAVANGSFCGGGFCGAPRASLNDGLLDVSLVDKVGRLQLLKLLPQYQKGTHLESEMGQRCVRYEQCAGLTLRSPIPMLVSVDGEISRVRELHFSVLPNAVQFSVPQGAELLRSGARETAYAR